MTIFVTDRWSGDGGAAPAQTVELRSTQAPLVIPTEEVQAFGGWTRWTDIDTPDGPSEVEARGWSAWLGLTCANPLAIDCRRKGDGAYWFETGEKVTCDVSTGFRCVKNVKKAAK